MEQLAERRNKTRLAIVEEVFEQNSGRSLGHTADLNAYGMMLIGKSDFPIGEKIRISLEIPNRIKQQDKNLANRTMQVVRTSLETHPFITLGFRFIYSTDFDIEYIETLFFTLSN